MMKEIEKGKIDADYGSGVIKQRLARTNEGKSGGYRCIILWHKNDKAFFVYGFAKNKRVNLTLSEKQAFKDLSKQLFEFSEQDLKQMVQLGLLMEITKHDE